MSHVLDGSLYSILTELPDSRKARGKVYPLPALLTMTVAAGLCGCKTLTAVAQWRHDYTHHPANVPNHRSLPFNVWDVSPCSPPG